MLIFITFLPNLVKDMKIKWSVTVTGFYEGSTCLNFKDGNIQMAYSYVAEKVRLCRSKKFSCSIHSRLVTLAIQYIERMKIAVVICDTDGKRMLPILTKTTNLTNVSVLVVHSLSYDDSEIDRAIAILKQSPYKRKIEFPFQYVSCELENRVKELQSQYSLMIQTLENSIVVQGYTENKVITVYGILQKMMDGMIKTVEFDCSKEQMQYLNLFEKPTSEAKNVLNVLSKSLSIKVQNTSISITLSGNVKAIGEGIHHINQLLDNFQVETIRHRCHPDFLSQIEKFVKEPLEKELNVVVHPVYYFSVHKSEKLQPAKTVVIYTKVYSTDSTDFKKACDVVKVSVTNCNVG